MPLVAIATAANHIAAKALIPRRLRRERERVMVAAEGVSHCYASW